MKVHEEILKVHIKDEKGILCGAKKGLATEHTGTLTYANCKKCLKIFTSSFKGGK